MQKDTYDKKWEQLWYWIKLRNNNLKKEKPLSVAQKQPLKRSIRKINHIVVPNLSRLFGLYAENILNLVSGCSMLARKNYKRRYDKVCLNTHRTMCKEYGFTTTKTDVSADLSQSLRTKML